MVLRIVALTPARQRAGADLEHGLHRILHLTADLVWCVVLDESTLEQTAVVHPSNGADAGRGKMLMPFPVLYLYRSTRPLCTLCLFARCTL